MPKASSTQNLLTIKSRGDFRSGDDLSPPSGLASTLDGELIVADDFNHRIQIYGSDGQVKKVFGEKGVGDGQFNYPRGIAVDGEGFIYVADSWNHRVQKFDRKGSFVLSFGGYGDAQGEMNEPYDVLVEPSGNIVVIERYNHRIQFFDCNGRSMGFIGSRATVMEDQLAWIYEIPPAMFPKPVFEFPNSIAKDSCGNYFIADSGNHRIVKFDPTWNVVTTFGSQGEEVGEFQYPVCVAIGSNDLLYVADLNNNRIQVFNSCGNWLFALKEGVGTIENPCLVKVNKKGWLYIAMTFQTRIEVFETPSQSREELRELVVREKSECVEIRIAEGLSLEEERKKDSAGKVWASAIRLLVKSELSLKDFLPENAFRIPIYFAKSFEHKTVREPDGSLLMAALSFYDNAVDDVVKKILSNRDEWETAACKASGKKVEEENRILQQKDDPLSFDRDLYEAEEEDKRLFLASRSLFFAYRFRTERRTEFSDLLLNGLLPESFHMDFLNSVRERFLKICEGIGFYLDKKEQNEEAMVSSFSGEGDNTSKWSDFRSRFFSNERSSSSIKHLHNELRMVLRQLTLCAKRLPSKIVEPILKELIIDSEGSAAIQKILLGLQEDWLGYPEVEREYLATLDAWLCVRDTGSEKGPAKVMLDNLSPVACEKEENIAEENVLTLLTESSSMREKNGILSLGHYEFFTDWPRERIPDLERQVRSSFKNMDAFVKKFDEIFNDLESLSRQFAELGVQLKNIDPRDKKSPIPIRNNSYVLSFQIGLLRRMIRTLEINEMNNALRGILGAALLTKQAEENGAGREIIENIKKRREEISRLISKGMKIKRDLFYKKAELDNRLSDKFSVENIGALEKRVTVMTQLENIQLETDRTTITLARNIRLKNLLGSMADITSDETIESFNGWKFERSFSGPAWDRGGFLGCSNVAVSPQGVVYVLDHTKHGVYRMTADGFPLSFFGGWGGGPGFMRWPRNIQVDLEGNIYVSDGVLGYVHKFSPEGLFIDRFGEKISTSMGVPNGVALDNKGRILVADTENNRVLTFTSSGELVGEIIGCSDARLVEPTGVCCFNNGNIVIADRSESLLKLFGHDGRVIKTVGRERITENDLYTLAYDSRSGFFAADIWNAQVIHFKEDLEVQDIIRRPGKRLGQFGGVPGVAIFNDSLYLADFENNRICIFKKH